MRTLRRMRERLGVRAASALAAATAVAMVLVVAGVSLVLVLESQLKRNTEEALLANAQQVAERIQANFADYRPGDPAKENAVVTTARRTDLVQVVTAWSDRTGAPDDRVGSNGEGRNIEVFASSEPLDGQPKLVDWVLAPHETRSQMDVPVTFHEAGGPEPDAGPLQTEAMMVVGLGVRAFDRPITIYSAQPTDQMHSAVDLVTWLVAGGVPLLVLVAGGFTYLFAGRALRPVEDMRSRVAGMGDKDLSQRVDEPAARDEVGRLARTMNQMLGRIESSQATQRRFVADASHELRSPLATVSTGLELLGAGMPEASADRATVDVLRGEASRLTGLVENLLFLARADERGIAPRREEVDLDEIADAERERPSAETAVAVRVTSEPVRVVGDRGQLVRVLRNLVDNAKRHASSTVAVSVRAEGDLAVIEVDDDGNGVAEADRARVFERFVRLDEARSRGDGGSGLGLAIVAELVAAHGGTVEAASSPELGGARFRVTVPAVTAPLPEEETPGPVDADHAGAGFDGEPAAELCDDRPSGPIPRVTTRSPWARAEEPADFGPAAWLGQGGADQGTPQNGTAQNGTASGGTAPVRPVMGSAVAPEAPARPVSAGPVGAGASARGTAAPDGMMRTPGDPAVTHGSGTDGRTPDSGPVTTPPDPEDDVSAPPAHSRLDPPTGPLPIRPDTVGSPFDENATRPLPVVTPRGQRGRGGTAVASRETSRDTRDTGREPARAEREPVGAPSPRRPSDRRR
ncbi:sensor histidine kinase [Pseudonocardia alni]|uniref:histidine kinase n=1 Tax=Pseudonocardia alni TaxID=33907 RepID=A0AA44UQ47_PSEA5|nr:HAMP domain-containing sensor histidine kinase [Pseudonocardia alni]PKB31336.1 signal transduction histidine kinase [Pseudonocardia alni]